MRFQVTTIAILSFLMGSAMCSGQVVINEVFYDPDGEDTECFVELVGKPGLSLDDYSLVGVNGDGGAKYNLIDLSGHRIPTDGYFVVAQSEDVPNADLVDSKANFQNGPDSIQLWDGDEKMDSVGYGDFSEASFSGEGKPTFDMSGYSIGRRPDGLDTNNNIVDFVGLALTSPGEPNGPKLSVSQLWKLICVWGSIKTDSRKN